VAQSPLAIAHRKCKLAPIVKAHKAHVKNGRLVMDEPTELPEGTTLELVSIGDVLANGGDVMDGKDRSALERELEASLTEAEAGQVHNFAEVLKDLRSKHGQRK
jgi:hypothetical protein